MEPKSPMQTPADERREYRKLPAVDAVLRQPEVALLLAQFGAEPVTATLRDILETARQAIAQGIPAPPAESWPARLSAALEAAGRPSLRSVINATGVIVHTNLGRAPLSQAALAAVAAVAQGYSNLEYDLDAGGRGSRHDHAGRLLAELTGAEDALVVNNNAGAVFLVLSALCRDQEVLISRGQLVEIGGGFRIPDVLRQSGARLVEVGTTNRTHPHDFHRALGPQTAAIMRVHSSNFRQLGFVAQPSPAELATIAHAHRRGDEGETILIDDLGSGTFLDTSIYGLAREPMVQESLDAGADIVTFSGDKLLGGPQAGLIIGRGGLLARVRSHPMARALRVDKMTLAALDATLRAYVGGRGVNEIPVWQMIAATPASLQARAETWVKRLHALGATQAAVWPGESAVGGGSLPGETLPTTLLAVPHADAEAAGGLLRAAAQPVICRIRNDHLLFDPRTVLPGQEEGLLTTLAAALGSGTST